MAHYQGEYDPGRLRRGAARAVKKLGEHQYRVRGSLEPYWDVNLELDTPCTCPDAQFHGRGCLHELAARLHDGDPKLMMALGEMLLAAEKHAAELAKAHRPRCHGTVWRFRKQYGCSRKATVERDGTGYCHTCDPVRKAAWAAEVVKIDTQREAAR